MNKELDIKFKDTWIRRYENLRGFSYTEYLKSNHWKMVKLKASKRPNYKKCEFCNSIKVDLHHTSYKWIFTKNELRTIIALCRNHHQEIHDYSIKYKISVRLATNKLRKIYKTDFLKKNRLNSN